MSTAGKTFASSPSDSPSAGGAPNSKRAREEHADTTGKRGLLEGESSSSVLFRSPTKKSTLGSSGQSLGLNRGNHSDLLVNVKTYKDPLYGSLELEPVIQRLIDTPQFQRLHGLKQLGTSDFVYRSCTHTRFEHCVGVAHLAQRFAEGLRRRQPELGISSTEVMCVKIAGLLHDLGHGPYSHMWDDEFVRRMGFKWKHERGSVDMLRFMLKDNNIDLSLFEPPLEARDVTFIEEMILGTPEKDRKGRGTDKEYLYDIVNNTRSGLDVDKLDYFQRDARNSVGDRCLDIDRFIELARVLPAEDENGEIHRMFCYPDKLWTEALGLFRTRMELHQRVYQHKCGKSVELMLVDAFELANPHFSVPGSTNENHPDGRWKLSEAVYDGKAFSCLKDSTVDMIMNDPNPKLAPAKAILERIQRRQLYPCVGDTEFDFKKAGITEDQARRQIIDLLKRPPVPKISKTPPRLRRHEENASVDERSEIDVAMVNGDLKGASPVVKTDEEDVLKEDDIIVEFMRIHWGLKAVNPVNRMRFFSKYAHVSSETQGVRLDEDKFASFLPRQFETQKIRVFVRDSAKVQAARKALDLFCREVQCASPCPLLYRD